jgi:nitrite reductase/ring-hydroxylating ferredoxin subunit
VPVSGHQRRVSIQTIWGVRYWPIMPCRRGLRDGPEVRRIAARTVGRVVTIGPSSKIFEGADRVVVQVETDAQELIWELLLLRRGRRFIALMNRCPHLGRTLEDSLVSGSVLVCPGHGKGYSLRPGQRRSAGSALCLLPVSGDGDTLVINIEGLSL